MPARYNTHRTPRQLWGMLAISSYPASSNALTCSAITPVTATSTAATPTRHRSLGCRRTASSGTMPKTRRVTGSPQCCGVIGSTLVTEGHDCP